MEGRESSRPASSQPSSMMMSPESYNASLQNSSMVSPTSGGMMQNIRLPFNPVSKPPTDSNSPHHGDGSATMVPCGLSMSDPVKRKRGRPRKYGPDGNMALALAPLSSVPGYSNATPPSSTSSYKRIGRPPGSGKKQQMDALGSAGSGFTPHVITVKAGEDVASKIMSFSQQGPRTVCILSANGAISNVTLRQPATSGGTVTYEGRFEIISLSGSYLLTESEGTRSRTGGLSVSLAGPDGRVLGGGVAGLLMAATPIQVIVGSFIAEGKKPKPKPMIHEPSSAPPQMAGQGAAEPVSPPSRGTMSESSGGPGSPVNQSAGGSNNINHPVQNLSMYAHVGWAGPQSSNQHRREAT